MTKVKIISLRICPDAFVLLCINRKIKSKLNNWETDKSFEDIRMLDSKTLEIYIESEWVRAKELDEKLYKLTASLSIAVTVGSLIAKTIFDGLAPTIWKLVPLFLLCLSVIGLLCGAWIGLNGLMPKPRYGYGAGYLRVKKQGGAEALIENRQAACGFQVMNLIRQNEVSSAIKLLRFGMITFIISILVSFIAPKTNQTSVHSTNFQGAPSRHSSISVPARTFSQPISYPYLPNGQWQQPPLPSAPAHIPAAGPAYKTLPPVHATPQPTAPSQRTPQSE